MTDQEFAQTNLDICRLAEIVSLLPLEDFLTEIPSSTMPPYIAALFTKMATAMIAVKDARMECKAIMSDEANKLNAIAAAMWLRHLQGT